MGLQTKKIKYASHWAEIELDEICHKITDGTHHTPIYLPNGVAFISVKDINNSKVDFSKCKYISKEQHEELIKRCHPEKDDLLVTKSGTIGRMAIVPDKPDFSLFVSVALIKNKKHFINTKFLKYCLENFFNSISIDQDIKGGLLKNFHLEDIRLTILPVVSSTEQQRILNKIEELLSNLDKGIESLKLAQQQFIIYRQSVLKWAFEGKLTNKNVKEGELPVGWTKSSIGNITKQISLKALPNDLPDSKFIGMDCIEPNTLKPYKLYDFREFKSAGNVFKLNQVLYGRMRPYLSKVYKAEFDGVCSGEFIVLECQNGFNPSLLKYILHHRDFVSFANHKTSGDRPRISYDEIIDYPVNICSPEEQMHIISEIEFRLSVCDKIEEIITQSLLQAEALRQSILKKAFEGKLVPQDPNDEPASVLLERIKAEREKNKKEKNDKIKIIGTKKKDKI